VKEKAELIKNTDGRCEKTQVFKQCTYKNAPLTLKVLVLKHSRQLFYMQMFAIGHILSYFIVECSDT